MLRTKSLRRTFVGCVLGVGVIFCTVRCTPSDLPGSPIGEAITTKFGHFIRKTILVGGAAPAAAFTKPAFLRFGPDGRLYVTSYTGSLFVILLDSNHEVAAVEEFKPFGNRLLTGLAFDPASPPGQPILYVVNNAVPLYGADDFTGRVSRVDDLGSGSTTDVIVGLPRSAENHMTFDLEFGPDGRLYISQGGNTNNGAPAPGLFANRPERLLSGAVLVADVRNSGFAGIRDVEVFAPGLRNAYGMCLHNNGQLYAVDQGSNESFGGRPGPGGVGEIDVPVGYKDSLAVLLPDHYYGHPNPARGQFAFRQDLPDGTPYQQPLKTFTMGSVATGMAEYDSPAGGGLQGKLLVAEFVSQNLQYVGLSADGGRVTDQGVLAGGFANPLDVAVGSDGTIYVLEAGGTLAFGGTGPAQITVLEPLGSGGGTVGPVTMFALSTICTECHTSLVDAAGNDVSMDADWRPTMMANAARDPLFQAKVSSEVARNPALKEVIEAKCATCHTPMARTQALADQGLVQLFDTGFFSPAHPSNGLAMDGVSCALCHQIEDVALGEEASFSGGYQIDTTTESPDRRMYGPFFNPEEDLMRWASGFTPVRGPQIGDAGLCATCHTLFTPTVDAQGNVVGEFPEQTPYLEWEHSEFGVGQGQTCQDCHMPAADGSVVVSVLPEDLPGHSPYGQHHFVGGNALMLSIYRAQMQGLGIAADASELDAALARTLAQLRNETADLSFVSTQAADNMLTVELKVDNKAGHKFPTGYPARRGWIHLTVADAAGQTVFESGAVGADGNIVGDDAAASLLAFEPHYDVISRPNQVQIYQAIMANSDGQVTYTLLRAMSYVKDNRLLPRGFDKQTADANIAVRGAAANDSDFVGGSDRITYQIDTGGHSGPFVVSAELLYQSVPPSFVEDLRQDETEPVNRFVDLYESADRLPNTVAQVATTVR